MSVARMAATVRTLASEAPTSIFRYFGKSIFNIPSVDASRASGRTTWSVRDNAGYTIPVGTLVGIRTAGDVIVPFQVWSQVVIPPGSTVSGTGEVVIMALEPGTASSGLTGNPELINPLDYVTGIGLVGTTTGGEDAEADIEYLDRLATLLQLMAPRPILPYDFAVMAQSVAGVDRALALDGYNPADNTFSNERMITVVPIDRAGATVGTPVKADVDAYLQAHREVNFDVHVIDPTFTLITVNFAAKAFPGYDISSVQTQAVTAVNAYLSPANWGQPATRIRQWLQQTTVRYLEIAQAILDTPGVDYIESLDIGIQGGTTGQADVTLAGVAPLPQPGTVTGVIHAP